jgi:glycerol dehydrogenase-like iron-containing ADH family enzyme
LEGRKPDDLEKIFGFCKAVGLPTTFEELCLRNLTPQDLETVADVASKHATIRSMPGASPTPDAEGRFYDQQAIFHALKAVDVFGRNFGKQSISSRTLR